MQCDKEIDCNDEMTLAKVQLVPPTIPAFSPVDLRALAEQLPDLSNMGNITVNIQANHYTPPANETRQIRALAVNTDAQIGYLRQEIKETLDKGNASITERFSLIGGWCQEVYNCQMRVGAQFQEVHHFL
jgi:hypothetical protein